MKKKIILGGLGLIITILIVLNLSDYFQYQLILSLKLALAIIIMILLYIIFIKMIKDNKNMAQELDYRLPTPNTAKLKKINKKLGKL